MKYAIVETGGKQYKAVEGVAIEVDKLALEAGKKLDLKEVLLISDGKKVEVGTPTVSGAKVKASVVDHFKGPKIIVFKYHPRKRYRLKRGHRQHYTRLMIEKIETKAAPKKESKAKPKTKTAPKSAAKKTATTKATKKTSTKTTAKKKTSTKK
ncbi:MAG: 50S ribosomal protein L21, partial [Anaerolineae bacterium]|nr:50S ribosomal protein L21 [Anaerolineae bacterium]